MYYLEIILFSQYILLKPRASGPYVWPIAASLNSTWTSQVHPGTLLPPRVAKTNGKNAATLKKTPQI